MFYEYALWIQKIESSQYYKFTKYMFWVLLFPDSLFANKKILLFTKTYFQNIAVLMAKFPIQDISRLLKQTISLEFQINLVIVSVTLLRAIVEVD